MQDVNIKGLNLLNGAVVSHWLLWVFQYPKLT
jgi:hypothetical protein